MRPLELLVPTSTNVIQSKSRAVRVLFVSEQLAVPQEVLPYLERLLVEPGIEVTFTFRHYRDSFKDWLLKHRPDLLSCPNVRIAERGLQEAIADSDVVVGTHSTAALEALLQLKPVIFFKTNKWGDYYNLKSYGSNQNYFVENPDHLIEKIRGAKTISVVNLDELRKRFFGDPDTNGSKWVVDQLEAELLNGRITK
jgi:hypothetical protein